MPHIYIGYKKNINSQLMKQRVEGKLLCKRCEKIVPSDYVNEIFTGIVDKIDLS